MIKKIDPTMLNVNSFWKKERDILYKWGKQDAKAEAEAKALEEKKAIARNLKDKGIDLKIIAEATGFKRKELEAL
ncbi:putative transposase/invertase (TIGR01784 family) [Pedobacter africanus]|uniref:Transposase/invertase (TIGR01784 family) n=1 Tax=Pedobacter africanus TaxID=151894 RepID=A0ACC6L4Z3_9SPHI|nr:hypothetical protein [Pedobacter africanus]MDR6786495.1 putative transposase/invertase (TIGR01784 family) [Pedobacter africanus]